MFFHFDETVTIFKYLLRRFLKPRIFKDAMIIGSKGECEKITMKLIEEKQEFINVKYLESTDKFYKIDNVVIVQSMDGCPVLFA